MNLTVANGYPVADGPNRTSETPDADAVLERFRVLGVELATEHGLGSEFSALYADYTAFRGKHPHAAFDEALRVLDIATPDDFVYYTDEDHG